ncbi:hypothetical protein QZH56_37005 (plasmid) [Streptomyces olivoreticuli]|uniref:hypothetical protein n=1 Tax=Streptomyces olivoreticuli TaxID=68246 RepID=UPI00265A3121|nr:hypothetical protein [Streptomyces olivoreticuli]WKK27852.1 hypothetical protein QZH56_37005 [Streptomyces olivoreticuli]
MTSSVDPGIRTDTDPEEEGAGQGVEDSGEQRPRLLGRERAVLSTGAGHVKAEFGRWWKAEDLTDTHIAHRLLNTQHRLWRAERTRRIGEAKNHIKRLEDQQKRAMQLQLQGRGYGPSPAVSSAVMRWSTHMAKIESNDFTHVEITPQQIAAGYGQARSRRHRVAAAVATVLAATEGAGLWWLTGPAFIATTGAAALGLLTVWAQGRRPYRREVAIPNLTFTPPALPKFAQDPTAEVEEEPFPVSEAGEDPRRAQAALRLALAKEKAPVREVTVPTRTAWGWQTKVILGSGTAGDIIKVLKPLATTLRVGEGRVLAAGSNPNDAAEVTLRVLMKDPFANPPALPYRPPLSCSILDEFSIGISLDGEPTDVILAGQNVIAVANTGGGKSAMVRAIAEYVTACYDAVAIDIDPTGRGLGPLRDCAARRAMTPDAAEAELERLLRLAEQRIADLPATTDNWKPTREAPAVIGFLDEYPRLTKKGKAYALDLLRIGRKARVTLVICSQDATADIMGDAVADAFGIRIMLPCRQADVPIVVGQSDAISKGWLPHVLRASPGEHDPADAGRFYCITPRHAVPIMRYVSHIDPHTALRLAQERVAAGLPSLGTAAAAAQLAEIAALLLAAFAAEGDPEQLPVARIVHHLRAADPDGWPWDEETERRREGGKKIARELKKAGLAVSSKRLDGEPGKPSGYRLADLHQALE